MKLLMNSIHLIVPVAYALGLRLLFGSDLLGELLAVMSIAFLFLAPFVVGTLTIYLTKDERNRNSLSYQMLMPWVPIFVFFVITLALSIEGWACWIMILPLYLLAASIGGVMGGALARRTGRSAKMSLLVLLPLCVAPLERLMETTPAVYELYTYIDMEAPPERIWANVTRVAPISEEEDQGRLTHLLGFPRPVSAELSFEGVGAYRKAIFTRGLVFHEIVTEYDHLEKMVFSIDARPQEIPSTTLDEHVVVGGEFFDVLQGTYRLEHLSGERYRLHLSSTFEMKTTFNLYAGWWGKLIMEDIQNNILQVQKARVAGKK